MKLFKLKTFVITEWGTTYDLTTSYYISHDVQNVIEQIDESLGYELSGSDGKWTCKVQELPLKGYSSMDRQELNVVLEEVEYIFV